MDNYFNIESIDTCSWKKKKYGNLENMRENWQDYNRVLSSARNETDSSKFFFCFGADVLMILIIKYNVKSKVI